jgi:hypothetical protein
MLGGGMAYTYTLMYIDTFSTTTLVGALVLARRGRDRCTHTLRLIVVVWALLDEEEGRRNEREGRRRGRKAVLMCAHKCVHADKRIQAVVHVHVRAAPTRTHTSTRQREFTTHSNTINKEVGCAEHTHDTQITPSGTAP